MDYTEQDLLYLLQILATKCNKETDKELLNKIDYNKYNNGIEVSLIYKNNDFYFRFIKYEPYEDEAMIDIPVIDKFFDKYFM